MRKKIIFAFTILTFILSGCLEINKIVYEPVPTSLEYEVSYGYYINSTGNGRINVTYVTFIPRSLEGYVTEVSIIGNSLPYKEITDENNNQIVIWCFEENGNKNLKIGIKARVRVQSFLVDLSPDLSQDIDNIDPNLKSRYCGDQIIGNETLIQPSNPSIKKLSESLKKTDDAFTIAKNIFKWLKKNTKYKQHIQQYSPQSAVQTLNLKCGDCDDLSILYISLCRSVGIPSRMIKGFLIRENEGKFEVIPHAWAEIFTGVGKNGWTPVECAGTSKDVEIEIHQNFGVEDAYHLRLYVDNGSNHSFLGEGIEVKFDSRVKVDVKSFVEIKDVLCGDYKKLVISKDGRRYYS